jgi:hypothetical protein
LNLLREFDQIWSKIWISGKFLTNGWLFRKIQKKSSKFSRFRLENYITGPDRNGRNSDEIRIF